MDRVNATARGENDITEEATLMDMANVTVMAGVHSEGMERLRKVCGATSYTTGSQNGETSEIELIDGLIQLGKYCRSLGLELSSSRAISIKSL